MSFEEFLKLSTTIRSLYSKEIAIQFFEKNVGQFYNLGNFNPRNPLCFEEISDTIETANA